MKFQILKKEDSGKSHSMFRDDVWHVSSHSHGPWGQVIPKHLPRGLRKHPYRQIVECRDREDHSDRLASHEGDYRGKTYKPGKDKPRHKHKKHDD